jgi:hypothetical protein
LKQALLATLLATLLSVAIEWRAARQILGLRLGASQAVAHQRCAQRILVIGDNHSFGERLDLLRYCPSSFGPVGDQFVNPLGHSVTRFLQG